MGRTRKRQRRIEAEDMPFIENTHPKGLITPHDAPWPKAFEGNQMLTYYALLRFIDMTHTPDGRLHGWTIPLTIADLAGYLGFSPKTVKRHLGAMVARGFIERESEGQWRVRDFQRYRIAAWTPVTHEELNRGLARYPFWSPWTGVDRGLERG